MDHGSEAQNISSLGQHGHMYMTYTILWQLKGVAEKRGMFQEGGGKESKCKLPRGASEN